MIAYPPNDATPETWEAWIEYAAPLHGPCNNDLHSDLRYLCGIQDRGIAAIAASGTVRTLRKLKLLT